MGVWLHRWRPLERWLKKHREKVERAEQVVRRWGMFGVIFGRFFAPTRSFVPLIAGSMRMSPVQFTVANAIGAVAWAFVTVEVGEEGIEFYERLPRKWSIGLLAAAAIAWTGWMLFRRIAARRNRHRSSSPKIPP
jgi:membrane-associated protein